MPLSEPAWGPPGGVGKAGLPGGWVAASISLCLRPSWRSQEPQAEILGYLLLISPALMRRERASSEECRPVCTRKPKPSPRGVAGELAEKPHLTWADTGIWNEAWQSGPRASHAAFPRVQALASPKLNSREEGGRSLPRRGKLGASPSVCADLRPPEAASPRSPPGAFAGILRISP